MSEKETQAGLRARPQLETAALTPLSKMGGKPDDIYVWGQSAGSNRNWDCNRMSPKEETVGRDFELRGCILSGCKWPGWEAAVKLGILEG